MKKIIRLTESDLIEIIKKVINENNGVDWGQGGVEKTKQLVTTNPIELKKFQDWMDTKGKWVAKKDQTGKTQYFKLNKGPGYGKFGPSTKAALDRYAIQYNAELTKNKMGSNSDQWYESNGYKKDKTGKWVKK